MKRWLFKVHDAVRRRWRSTGGSDDGFLLLETLAAVAIMAFMLSVLPSSVVVSRQTIQKSADIVGGRLVAETVLAGAFALPDFTAGEQEGVLEGYSWSLSIRPNTALEKRFSGKRWIPYDVTVRVLVPNSRELKVETIRLGAVK